jgi:chromosome segregation ATPase
VHNEQEQAVRVLEAALARSGAQDTAHTALEHARALAAQTARQPERQAERAAARAAAVERARRHDRPLPAEHARAVGQLEQCRGERDQLRADRTALHRSLQQAQTELQALPRWARSRRRALTDTISSSQQRLQHTQPAQATLEAEVDRLTRLVAHHTRQRARDLAAHDLLPSGTDVARAAELTWPQPAVPGTRDPFSSALARPHDPYRGPERDTGGGLSR